MWLSQTKSSSMKQILVIICAIASTTGLKFFSSKNKIDSVKYTNQAGYYGEEHKVQTEDGYILTLHRILPALNNSTSEKKRPVYLQHGLTSSSSYWLSLGKKQALPYILSDAGYDVWMGNCRGNVISQEHTFLTTDSQAFWEFSFHEMGVYDLPAMFNYVLNTTQEHGLYYIGNSMGSTMFFVMASLRPELASKVKFAVTLAPIVIVKPVRGVLRFALNIMNIILSKTDKQIEIFSRYGVSKKTVIHYLQLYLTGKFTMYNYGPEINTQRYNTSMPPTYFIKNITVPVFLCYGTEDPFATEEDVNTLRSSLGAVVGQWSVPFDHFEFAKGKIEKRGFYGVITSLLHKFSFLKS